MKKPLLILLLLWQFNIALAQTNIYHPFPAANAIWNNHYMDCFFYECYDYSYYMPGDTTINGITYHKINKQVQSYAMITTVTQFCQSGCCCTNQVIGHSNSYVGALREDAGQKKVYIVQADSASEQLLYDFNLNVGDTVKGYFNYSPPLIVTSIDSVLVGVAYRKNWNLNQQPMSIIEGIGLTPDFLKIPWWEAAVALNCFSENNQTLYPVFDNTSACTILTSIANNDNTVNFSILPNHSNGRFQLVISDADFKNVTITDVLGNNILKKQINNESTVIDLSEYPNGIYFVKTIDSKGNFIVKKIVKQ